MSNKTLINFLQVPIVRNCTLDYTYDKSKFSMKLRSAKYNLFDVVFKRKFISINNNCVFTLLRIPLALEIYVAYIININKIFFFIKETRRKNPTKLNDGTVHKCEKLITLFYKFEKLIFIYFEKRRKKTFFISNWLKMVLRFTFVLKLSKCVFINLYQFQVLLFMNNN